MQASHVMSCQTGKPSRSEKCSRQSREARAGFSGNAAPAISRRHKEASRQPRGQAADFDSRTHMLLEQPIVPTIMRLAIPNAAVMTVQVLIGLLEVYFVSRLGVDALAGVALVFPLVSLVLAVAQGAIGGGFVTTVARALGTGRMDAASEYAWYAVTLSVPLGLATTAVMVVFGPGLYGHMGISGNALAIALSYSSTIFAGATLIWLFNLLMAVVRGTGNLQVPVIVVGGGALILVPLSPALIFGAFGYPGLGPSGGAVAMLVYYAFGTLAYAAYIWGKFGVLKPSFRVPKLSLAPALAILRVGGMSAIVSATTNLTLAIVTAYVGMGGIEALAARVSFGAPCLRRRRSGRNRGEREPRRRQDRTGRKGVMGWCSDGLRPDRIDRTGRGCLSEAVDRNFQSGSIRAAGWRRISAPRRAVFWILWARLCSLLRRTSDQTDGSLCPRRSAQGRHRGARGLCGCLVKGRRHMEFRCRGVGNGRFRPVRIATSG
jgi:hypothetical protein